MRIELFIVPVLAAVAVFWWKARATRRASWGGLLAWVVVMASTTQTLLTMPPDSTRFRWSLFVLIAVSGGALASTTYRAYRAQAK
jgi:hypothetical protein